MKNVPTEIKVQLKSVARLEAWKQMLSEYNGMLLHLQGETFDHITPQQAVAIMSELREAHQRIGEMLTATKKKSLDSHI